jgi:hypothetical protein
MKTYYFFFVTLLMLFCCWGCKETAPFTFGYTNIKEVPTNRYEATGYFTNDPVPMLVNDPKWLIVNMPMPPGSYLFLTGSNLDSIVINPDSTRLYGALLKITGTAQQDSTFKNKKIFSVENVEVNGAPTSDRGPRIVDHCLLPGPDLCTDFCNNCPSPPNLCDISTPSPHKFALLFSGGVDLPNAKYRYWNDLEFMYLTLRSQYGFSDANMVVLYMDGVKENLASTMQVDFPASGLGINNAIAHLNTIMHNHSTSSGIRDTLFLFVTNHGGGYDMLGIGGGFSGAMDGSGWGSLDEPEPDPPGPKVDEVIYYYPTPISSLISIKDDLWKSKWDGLLTSKNPLFLSLYEQCFSGGFLDDMKAPKRVNIAAASENGYSYSLPSDNIYDAFSYYFTSALYGRNADGSCLKSSPDIDFDGKVSIWEAYRFAHLSDLPHDTHRHFLDDLGTGIGIEGITPTSLTTGQGTFSSGVFLK